jgi:hypothetical protein
MGYQSDLVSKYKYYRNLSRAMLAQIKGAWTIHTDETAPYLEEAELVEWHWDFHLDVQLQFYAFETEEKLLEFKKEFNRFYVYKRRYRECYTVVGNEDGPAGEIGPDWELRRTKKAIEIGHE